MATGEKPKGEKGQKIGSCHGLRLLKRPCFDDVPVTSSIWPSFLFFSFFNQHHLFYYVFGSSIFNHSPAGSQFLLVPSLGGCCVRPSIGLFLDPLFFWVTTATSPSSPTPPLTFFSHPAHALVVPLCSSISSFCHHMRSPD